LEKIRDRLKEIAGVIYN